LRTHLGMLTLLAVSMTMLIVGASSGLAAAQVVGPCTATLSYPQIPVQYGNTNPAFVVPVSASCTTDFGSQLYATANAYDTTSNTALGSTNTVLSSVNGGPEFNGQLGFNLPPTQQGDAVQISVSVYEGQGGNLLTTTSETIPVGTAVQPPIQEVTTVTSTVTQSQPYADPDPTPLTYQSYQLQPQPQGQNYPSYQTHHQSFARSNNSNLLDYVAIIAIVASVIIATVGLVLVGSRKQQQQPVWYPAPPPPR